MFLTWIHFGSSFYVNEDLMKFNQKDRNSSTLRGKNTQMWSRPSWSTDGKIFVKKISDSKMFIIKAMADFQT